MRKRCPYLDKVGPWSVEGRPNSVGSFGIFSRGSKNKLLVDAAEFAAMASFQQLFRSSIFGAKNSTRRHQGRRRHQGTKNTQFRARRAGMRQFFVSSCLGGRIEHADRFPAISFARSEVGHKAEQFSHEQIWQKPERSLGKRRRPQKAWDRRITPVPHGFSADRRHAETGASRRAPTKRAGHKIGICRARVGLFQYRPAARRPTRSVIGVDGDRGAAPSPTRHDACEKSASIAPYGNWHALRAP